MGSSVSAVVRLALFVLWTLVALFPHLVMLALGLPRRRFVRAYWRVVARIINLSIHSQGQMCDARPVLVVANHVSYLDVIVLGALIPGTFVAKSEVGDWPGFGLLARLGETVFVTRKRMATGAARAALHERLTRGDPLVLFPEGTSNDGNRVLPFKSALFAVADADPGPGPGPKRDRQSKTDTDPLVIQPVSLAYTRVNGLPIGRAWRPLYAWYGDMALMPHLLAVLGFGATRVEVVFHPPVRRSDFPSRKALAVACQTLVAKGVEEALTGRPAA